MIGALLLTLALSQEKVAEVRVHGNATLTDEAVIGLAGIVPGTTLDAGSLEAIEKRLKDSGRFDEVQVRKRYRTLAMDEVALLLVVHEKAGVTPSGEPPSAMRRLRNRMMFFPIIGYDDGYGWTYGARTTFVNVAGKGTHVSVPLSWGATRRADVEVDRTFHSGPLTRATGSFGVVQRENPFYRIDDHRVELKGRAERRLFRVLTLGGEAAQSRVSFEPSHDQFWSAGADVTLDTRNDPAFPSDAVLASASWTRMNANSATAGQWGVNSIDRYRVEARGYKRLIRRSVIAVRTEYASASTFLPPYEQYLLGGANLRGVPAGTFAGDTRLLGSAELRMPSLTTVMSAAHVGFNVFFDTGKVAPYGARLADQKLYRSGGGGFFIVFAMFQLNFEVSHSLDGQGTRFHFGTGFSF
jgi:outer membrane protein assembly factor BamA